MLLFFFLNDKFMMILAWVLQSIGYFYVLKKIDENPVYSMIPFFAEWRISKYLYNRLIVFLRPFLITLVLVIAGFYMNPLRGMGKLLIYVAFIVYFCFLVRMYSRLIKSFNKPFWYYIIMFLFPPLFLYMIGHSKEYFHGPTFKIGVLKPRFIRYISYALTALISIAEVVGIALLVSIISIRQLQPRILANHLLEEAENKTKNVVADGVIVTNQDALGINSSIIEEAVHSRDYFFPDHSNDKSVVVMEYIIGSNLENAGGLATANIKQIKDATTKGEHLSFVLQIGGSFRWFTEGIEENSNGRYTIKDGDLTLVEKLDDELCMSEPKSLEDFIKWTKSNYPADRYILVLWDHGGGFSQGYGSDSLNKRKGVSTMLVNEMVQALDNAGVKFDFIGFDACLMQNLETAVAFEPYADYYIASEEVEGGYGWFYTSAFGKLAQNPGLSTLEFAKELISAYDVYNTALKDGKIDSTATLSIVDLTMIKPVYQELVDLFKISNEAILKDPEYYADIAVSATKAYQFNNKEQIDLINYLKILDDLDYNNDICKDNSCLILADRVAASIPYRNNNSAQGVNGMAFTFPVNTLYVYNDIYKQFKEFNMNDQMQFYNNYFSIMAAQSKQKDYYESEQWYVKGFEEYDTTKTFIDIPLTETENGYKIDLPEKVKKIISDVEVAVYQKEGDRLKYIGKDFPAVNEIDGDIYFDMDNRWIHVNNTVIAYESTQEREVEEGTIFTGTTRAMLNGQDEILIHIEWEPVKEGSDKYPTGKIIGYEFVEEFKAFMSKGLNELKSGDRLNFIFDYYDLQGNFIEQKPSDRTFYVGNPEYVTVRDKQLRNCELVFNGVLTDVYQREFLTEQINYIIK